MNEVEAADTVEVASVDEIGAVEVHAFEPDDEAWSLEPLGDVVIVDRDPQETTSAGGIVLIPSATPPACRGTVVAAGPGVWGPSVFHPTTLRPGDRVLISKWWGDEIDVQGRRYVFGREGDVLSRIVGEDGPDRPDDGGSS